MSQMTATIYNHKTGEERILPMLQASHEVRAIAGVWSFEPAAPRGWKTQVPRYRLTIALKPAARDRTSRNALDELYRFWRESVGSQPSRDLAVCGPQT